MIEEKQRVPVVIADQALKSLRDSGYSLSAALAEVIDNCIEANANIIRIRLDEKKGSSGKKRIHRIVFVDDGDGMDYQVLQYYLQLGFSTRYMRTDTIGKYGVGAKLAALNYAQRIDAWSCTNTNEGGSWLHVYFDLKIAAQQAERSEVVGIDPPNHEPLPEDIALLQPPKSGTIIVWSDVDRLEEGRWAADANALRVEIEKELSRIFRNFLHGGIQIWVNDTKLVPHDPLFLMEGTWADKILTQEYHRTLEKSNQIISKTTREMHFEAQKIVKETIPIVGHTAIVTITLYPPEVVRQRHMGGDELARKLRVPENEGAISFVRLDREINYTQVPRIFPRGVEAPDRFIGIEVTFTPELDEYFGVRNVKRGVEPHDELRTKIREVLKKYIPEARAKLDEIWGKTARKEKQHKGEHDSIVQAAGKANKKLPKSRAKGPSDKNEQKRILDDLAEDAVGPDENKQHDYQEQIKDLPFVLESIDFPGNMFIDIEHVNGQVIIRINTRHRFYREIWEPIRSISTRTPGSVSGDEAVYTARRTIEALTLLLIAYGKAESMHDQPREAYSDLRGYWGQFLESLMRDVKDVI